ncbi:MAG: hypothetical protein WD010_02540 [Nitriliruptor sp.]|uniref:hypothetical protein n=1 Tax=Nitriliruptor sp. TaxID=2448056 RepID=UPI00349FF4C8
MTDFAEPGPDEPVVIHEDGTASPPGPHASAELVAAALAALAESSPAAAPRNEVARVRVKIRDLVAVSDGEDVIVTVTLALGTVEATTQARDAATRRGRWRATAEATLAALTELSAGRIRGTIDFVNVMAFADLAVNVAVTLITPNGEETFLGAALVRDDPDRAVLRATLDAVNRRIEVLLTDDLIEPSDIIDAWGSEIPDAPL